MALVIRTLYNNQNWMAPCKQPFVDKFCYVCRRNSPGLNITLPRPGDMVCSGSCWEQTLCKEYYWGCTPEGNMWGDEAYPGIKVFFVFRQRIKTGIRYTLWAKTSIKSVKSQLNTSGGYGKTGYNLMYFNKFTPASTNNWKWNLTAESVVGSQWGSGNYRYIGNKIESVLDSMI